MPSTNDLRQFKRREQRFPSSELQGWKILVVDDQVDNLTVAYAALSFCGATVLTAENGMLGMQIVQQHSDIKLIILDLSMPEMNGWTMFEMLRQNAATTHIPVIALTAHAMEGDQARVMQAGFNGYIAKPFSVANLAANILAIVKEEKPL
jgi:CheY-like chemotaxis protein